MLGMRLVNEVLAIVELTYSGDHVPASPEGGVVLRQERYQSVQTNDNLHKQITVCTTK